MKLADINEGSSIPAELGVAQHSLDLVVLEESKASANGNVTMMESETKAYNNEMSDNFAKQMVRICVPISTPKYDQWGNFIGCV